MTTIKNDAELKKFLQSKIQNAVNSTMGQVQKEGFDKIRDEVYSYPATEYIRTGEFMDAWKSDESGDIGNIANGTYDYDPAEIRTFGGGDSFPENAIHQSFVDGKPSAEELPDYIYEGYQGALPKRVPARNAFKKLDKWFSEAQIRKLFGRGLRKEGLKVIDGGATKTEI